MPNRLHRYALETRWTGNRGSGTSGYREYDRSHEVAAPARPRKPAIAGSSDPTFRGDPDRWSPEELLVAALSQCHMLWYLHLAAEAGVVVTAYEDAPVGTMEEAADGSGRFTTVVLRPVVTVAEPSMAAAARPLHERAHEMCFIARSVNFAVDCEPAERVATAV